MPLTSSGNRGALLAAVFDAQYGWFATGWSPASWGSIDELFVNLTMPSTVVEEADEGGGSRAGVRVEAVSAFAGYGNPTVRPRRYEAAERPARDDDGLCGDRCAEGALSN